MNDLVAPKKPLLSLGVNAVRCVRGARNGRERERERERERSEMGRKRKRGKTVFWVEGFSCNAESTVIDAREYAQRPYG
jgi:hypothetical protein